MAEFSLSLTDGNTDELAKLNKTLNWLLNNLDHTNIKRLYTEYCSIQSENGETVLDGPLLTMKTALSSTIRLKIGYDPSTSEFLFALYNEAGDLTIGLDSSGDAYFTRKVRLNELTSIDVANPYILFFGDDLDGPAIDATLSMMQGQGTSIRFKWDKDNYFLIEENYAAIYFLGSTPETRLNFRPDGMYLGSIKLAGILAGVGTASVVIDPSCTADGDYAFACGNGTDAEGYAAFTSGLNTTAYYVSHAEGYGTIAQDCSHTEGLTTKAFYGKVFKIESFDNVNKILTVDDVLAGDVTDLIGSTISIRLASSYILDIPVTGANATTNTITLDTALNITTSWLYAIYDSEDADVRSGNHAEGEDTLATNASSHAEGCRTLAGGYTAHVEGYDNIAYGYASHAQNQNNIANGESSHVEGDGNIAGGVCSHAGGTNTTASGDYSNSDGYGTEASGWGATAKGDTTVASGDCAQSSGWGTIAQGYNQLQDTNWYRLRIAGTGQAKIHYLQKNLRIKRR